MNTVAIPPKVTQAAVAAAEPSPDKRKGWLLSPTIDLIFVCGLAPWIFGLFLAVWNAPFLAVDDGAIASGYAWFFAVMSLLIGETHQFTSIVRFFALKRQPKKGINFSAFVFRMILTCGIIVLVTAAAFAVHLTFGPHIEGNVSALIAFGQIAIAFFPVMLMHHVCAQAYGIGVMYCGMNGYKLSRCERWLLQATNWSLVVTGAMTIAQPFIFGGSGSSESETLISVFVAQCLVALCAERFTVRWLIRRDPMPIQAVLIWTNLALFTLVRTDWMPFVWLFVPLFYHATQHWAVALATERKEAQAAGRRPAMETLSGVFQFALPIQAITFMVLFAPLLIPGAKQVLNNDNPTFQSLPMGWSMLVFYLHYFSDRTVWRS